MDLSGYLQRSNESLIIKSSIPSRCSDLGPYCLGIDEAGRGPVLGPMVYAAFYCPFAESEKLKHLGFADSKTLSEEKREQLFVAISENASSMGWSLEVHAPSVISNRMLQRNKFSLNAISQDSAEELVRQTLADGVPVQEVYVDTVGPPETYQAKLSRAFPDLSIIVAKKADATFPCVSAASICAKVARDRALKCWAFVEGSLFNGSKYGSGYPNDPDTKSFLAKILDPVFGFPQLVRFSWSTADKILLDRGVPVKWDEAEKDKDQKSRQSLQNLFKISQGDRVMPKCHGYFKTNCLAQFTKFS